MNVIKLIVIFGLCFSQSGCGFLLATHMIDKVVEMQKAQLEHEKEMRLQFFTIEGQIEKSESVDKKIEVSHNSIHDKSIEVQEKYINEKFFVVTFVDGREKEFRNIPLKPLNVGEYYQITYNGMNEITEIARIEK